MRKTLVGVKVDEEALRLLHVMAQSNEGNLSRTVRDIIKETARIRGLTQQGANSGR